jgi:hypothetical protein
MGTTPFVSVFGEAKARHYCSWIKNGTLVLLIQGVFLAAAFAFLQSF